MVIDGLRTVIPPMDGYEDIGKLLLQLSVMAADKETDQFIDKVPVSSTSRHQSLAERVNNWMMDSLRCSSTVRMILARLYSPACLDYQYYREWLKYTYELWLQDGTLEEKSEAHPTSTGAVKSSEPASQKAPESAGEGSNFMPSPSSAGSANSLSLGLALRRGSVNAYDVQDGVVDHSRKV